MKTNNSGLNVKGQPTNDSDPHTSQTNLKSYIDGLKKVTGGRQKQRNPAKQG